jgi:nickel-dependent lactate racemase
LLVAKGGAALDLSDEEIEFLFIDALSKALNEVKGRGPVLILPPDITRFHSKAGFLTDIAAKVLGNRLGAVMPALGTHMAMTGEEQRRMFPQTPSALFRVHDWRNDAITLGRIDKSRVENITEGKVRYDWPVQVSKLLLEGGFSMILSLGQVVPHEVTGMANHLKNIFIGTGGKEAIDKSHFAGASYGMERIMGRTETPVRSLLDEGYKRFGDRLPPVFFALTVVCPRTKAVRGLYTGFGRECFEQAAVLSRKVNVNLLDEPIKKAVVYLNPEEFRTTWLGNKAIYRTRMAMADGGELLILAPGLERFGEDHDVDKLIRKYGYQPGSAILKKVEEEKELVENLSVAAHLIHGSSEERFTVRYCPGPGVSRTEIESVGYEWGSLDEAMARYNVEKLLLGWNTMDDGEEIFFVSNPALGLWASSKRFTENAGN